MNASIGLQKPGSNKGLSSTCSRRFIVECGLYTTSIIVGAGILGLPTLTATIGLLPAVGMTLVLGFGLTFVYVRIAAATHAAVQARIAAEYERGMPVLERAGIGRDALPQLTRNLGPYLVDRKGAGIIDAICSWPGFGSAGKTALMVGLTAFVVPAMVLYLVSGGMALSAIAGHLESTTTSPVIVGAASASSLIISVWASHSLALFVGRAALCAFSQMIASWLGGIAILMVVPEWRPLSLLLFAATIAGFIIRSVPQEHETRRDLRTVDIRRRIEPAHQVGAIIAVVNLVLLTITAALALLVLQHHDQLARPEMIASSLTMGDLAKALGGLLFAFTGTGIFNLIKYPVLFDRESHSGQVGLGTVVILGTVIPTIAYVGWMLAIAFTLAPSVLVQSDDQRSYATVPLAALLTEYGSVGWIVFVTGYTVALLAVTSAGIGFSESLAERLARIHKAHSARPRGGSADTSDLPEAWRVRRAQVGVVVLSTGLALLLQTKGDAFAFRDILSVAGYAGGGLLLLVLPFFIPTGGRRQSPKRDIALVTIIAFGLATLNMLELPDGFGQTTSGTLAGITIISTNLMFVISFIWLLVSDPADEKAKGY